ncbi:hypothetical protein SK128_000312, partial [Halocaridina rubra]
MSKKAGPSRAAIDAGGYKEEPTGKNGLKNEESKLVVGAAEDLSTLNLDEPAGETADWLTITKALAEINSNFLVKVAYMLSTRGQEQKNSHRGTRIVYRDGENNNLCISFATESSSMLKTELTPGRFRTAVAGLIFAHHQLRISPVMSVIGLNILIDKWDSVVQTVKDKVKDSGHIFPINSDELVPSQQPISFEDSAFPKLYALAPDRVPPHYAHVTGALELGMALSLCQDIRNTVLASLEQGTVAQKNRQKSEFHRSFTRRSAAMGFTANPLIWPIICKE